MVGVKLRSGKLSEFVATGTDGAPVYTSADQLRVAIRRHLGQESADYFAVAKPNDTGNGIEWYAPNRGTVIPWSSATEDEKAQAKAMLVEAREKILAHSATLLKHDNAEQQLFGKMLEKSVRIPDDSHVYIVNGKPVMTFWGFDKPNAPAGVDIIKTLVAVPNVAQETVDPIDQPEIVQEEKRSFWWWLIPLLLLLLLLLLFLWWYFQKVPTDNVATNGTEQYETAEDPVFFSEDDVFGSIDADEEQKVDVHDEDHTDTDTHIRYGDDRDYHGGTRNIDTTRITGDNVDNITDIRNTDILADDDGALLDTTGDAVLDGTDTDGGEGLNGDALSDAAETPIEEEIMGDEGTLVDSDALEEDVPLPDGIDAAGDATADGAEQTNQPGDSEIPDNMPDNMNAEGNPSANNESQAQEPPQNQATNNRQSRRSSARAQPLRIPPEALQNGSTEFMDGQWASHAGLIDGKTGKPIKVEYDINDGAGKARIKRPDGSVCSGDVGTSIENGQLIIAGQNAIRCPDGVTYDTSRVVCSNNANGSGTNCKGINNSGGDYPVKLRQSQ